MPGNEYGLYYFKVKQRYPNGFVKFSDIKSVEFQNPFLSKIFLYPNPSSGIVGIKFVNIPAGKLWVHIFNVQGQTVVSKELEVSDQITNK
ncbi:MAG: T9SS type A sorting domain-containing protein [Bacteroidota bacterium]|nr:T9SS type A sorting domain-containing protein [Bacteroidota bacterium]